MLSILPVKALELDDDANAKAKTYGNILTPWLITHAPAFSSRWR